MATRSPTPSRRILETLYSRIERVLESAGQKRYGTTLRVERTDAPSSESSEISARIEGPSVPRFLIRLTVHPLGKKASELRLEVDERPARSFIYCPPDGSRSACGRMQLERKVLSFILDEMDRRIGAD